MSKRTVINEELLKKLRTATGGTVSDIELTQAVAKAIKFHVPVEQFVTMLAFSHQRATQNGKSIDVLLESAYGSIKGL